MFVLELQHPSIGSQPNLTHFTLQNSSKVDLVKLKEVIKQLLGVAQGSLLGCLAESHIVWKAAVHAIHVHVFLCASVKAVNLRIRRHPKRLPVVIDLLARLIWVRFLDGPEAEGMWQKSKHPKQHTSLAFGLIWNMTHTASRHCQGHQSSHGMDVSRWYARSTACMAIFVYGFSNFAQRELSMLTAKLNQTLDAARPNDVNNCDASRVRRTPSGGFPKALISW